MKVASKVGEGLKLKKNGDSGGSSAYSTAYTSKDTLSPDKLLIPGDL